ncbi:MAG: ribonuclease P protein component [candidate division KSB1 bacterium]|nr:ribonuclease P protein component [candidate division KSB1 bacterium]MDZ7348464.1 ribonuclease P protein component [candidate division KSB1 bacterium]MDZ7352264.1 ribonuclease P protein component [candidate division KSB1 bacterium]MDZ7382407.1 ribonuclease P protein component [candidate division KSB1 bacterium]MDZ7415774.1 ribonuclease P protein component [candidate division KSB1 bacterium]
MTNDVHRRYGLPKTAILRGARRFQELFEKGRHQHGQLVDMVWMKAGSRQVAFAASRRVKRAVQRNAVKRRLREAYRLEQHEFAAGAAIIFIGHARILEADFEAVRAGMRRLARILAAAAN